MPNQTAKTKHSSGAALRAALILNIVFLAVTVIVVRVGFESNDDLTLAAFVDGQMAESTAYVPYVNIVLGALMKLSYDVLGREVAWHTFGQYLLLFTGFTAATKVLMSRLGVLRGGLVATVLLLFFGVDVYVIINYTKTAAVCTVGGMLLLVDAAERARPGKASLVLGVLLCVFGYMLRDMEFLPCFALMAMLCLRPAWEILTEKGRPFARRMMGLARLALPFAAVLAIAAGLHVVNEAAWSRAPWSFYHEFDRVRVAYSDYGRPPYEDMPEVYDELGLTESAVGLLYESNYFDPDVFSAETMEAIREARDERFPRPSPGECLGLLLDKYIPGLFINLHIYGLLFLLALWIAVGSHRVKDWLCFAAEGAVLLLLGLYLVYRGRYLVDRVDVGLLYAAAAVLAAMLEEKRMERERLLCVLLLLGAIGTSHYLMRDWYRTEMTDDFSAERAAVERILRDEEHVYLAKTDAVCDRIYSPFEPAGKGYWDRIVLLGGFDCCHPTIMANLARYGVENPYRDCIGNSRVYLIEDDIDLTLRYLRDYYDENARAELVEPLSTETGLAVYRILN